MIYTIPNVYAHSPPTNQLQHNRQILSGQTLNGQTADQRKFATVMIVSIVGYGLWKLWEMGKENAEE